ncbi:hypothetical protein BKA56DRAFT_612320 [Ilyonectria sp. MPI-CAGE-AT-0026]|nr:hypothetical protein BKA56DRAFT_612320 [Ilyonectria sp. MPI-CAGE-AT-0026]
MPCATLPHPATCIKRAMLDTRFLARAPQPIRNHRATPRCCIPVYRKLELELQVQSERAIGVLDEETCLRGPALTHTACPAAAAPTARQRWLDGMSCRVVLRLGACLASGAIGKEAVMLKPSAAPARGSVGASAQSVWAAGCMALRTGTWQLAPTSSPRMPAWSLSNLP